MMLARVCRATITPQVRSFLRAPIVPNVKLGANLVQTTRLFASESRSVFVRTARRKPTVTKPGYDPKNVAFHMGGGVAVAFAGLSIGALCFYGLGLSDSESALDRSIFWPQYVRDRIRETYMYFGGSVLTSSITAAFCVSSPMVMRFLASNGWVSLGVSLVALIGSGMVVRSLPYTEELGAKHLAWLLHASIVGAIVAPLTALGGPLLIRAAMYTAGIAGGLSALAMCAPNKTFLVLGGTLSMGLGVVFCSSLAGMFLPPTTAVGMGLYSISLYGGLILFTMMLMYETQRTVHDAETHPVVREQYQGLNPAKPFDPINHAINIYIDTINIFIRMFAILADGKRK